MVVRRIRKQSGFEKKGIDPGDKIPCEWFSRRTRKHGGIKRRVRHGRSEKWRTTARGARSTLESTSKHWKSELPSSPPATSEMSNRQAPPVRANRRGMLPELLDHKPPDQQIAGVTADGAFDTRKCHDAIAPRGAAAIIPPRKNVRPLEARQSRRDRAERGPVRIKTLRPDDLAQMERLSPPKPRRDMRRIRKRSRGSFSRRSDALCQTAGPTSGRSGLRPTGGRVPDPHGRAERLHRARNADH